MDSILQNYCERVLTEVFVATENLNLYGKIYELPNENNEVYKDYQYFWDFAKNSILYSGTIALARIYDNDKNVISIYKILNYSQCNKPTEEVKNQISIFYEKLNRNKEKIENLTFQRNKFYVHSDKVSIEKILENTYLTHGDKIELIKLGKEISEYFLSYSKGEEKITHLKQIQNSIYAFDTIIFSLERFKKLIENTNNEFY